MRVYQRLSAISKTGLAQVAAGPALAGLHKVRMSNAGIPAGIGRLEGGAS
ncbi:MAG: hypothetical protein HY706_04160 [Candidatus Hydrogenedentes bacterium]|nr:hypothetical protein [Candidatus Hydrogenedentota bacterium]